MLMFIWVVVIVVVVFAMASAGLNGYALEGAAATAAGEIICPHCGTAGSVTARNKGLGDVLTSDVSLLATPFGRQRGRQQLSCSSCATTWFVA